MRLYSPRSRMQIAIALPVEARERIIIKLAAITDSF